MQGQAHLQIRPWLEESATESVYRHVALISHEESLLGDDSTALGERLFVECLWGVNTPLIHQ